MSRAKGKPRLSKDAERAALANWWSKDDVRRSIDTFQRDHDDPETVSHLAQSLLDMINRSQSRADGFFPLRGWYWWTAARLLLNPDYPGTVHIPDEVRSGLLLYVITNDYDADD